MMGKKILKYIGYLLLAALVVVLSVSLLGTLNLNQSYAFDVEQVTVPHGDAAAIARGEYIFHSFGNCADCHLEDLRGSLIVDEPAFGQVYAPNLTTGVGGVGATLSDEDFVRAIRHGLDPQGRPLHFMPAQNFVHMSKEDLGAVIAYIRSAPAVDHVQPDTSVNPQGNILMGVIGFNQSPVQTADHALVPPDAVAPGMTDEYGHYLMNVGGCVGCHGADLGGYQESPANPFAPNIRMDGEPGGWTEAQFIAFMRSGTTPAGRQVDPFMPWEQFRHMTDEDLQAIWLYLQNYVPPASQS
jgi:mono/diheme cytochrome c family protein